MCPTYWDKVTLYDRGGIDPALSLMLGMLQAGQVVHVLTEGRPGMRQLLTSLAAGTLLACTASAAAPGHDEIYTRPGQLIPAGDGARAGSTA